MKLTLSRVLCLLLALLLLAMAAAFAGILLIAGRHFELVPLTGNAWIALLALSALGAVIVFGAAFVIRRKKLGA